MPEPERPETAVPEFEPVPMDPSTTDTIRRQNAYELWRSSPFHYQGRP
jgi:hypothetical protein